MSATDRLEQAFTEAKKAYPDRWISGHQRVWLESLFDEMEGEEVEIPHIWRLVDAVEASFRTPERVGMFVLQEYRPGSNRPSNHWGFMIHKSEVQGGN